MQLSKLLSFDLDVIKIVHCRSEPTAQVHLTCVCIPVSLTAHPRSVLREAVG
jgi:hypothetical protein